MLGLSWVGNSQKLKGTDRATVEAGRGGRQKGRSETSGIQDFWVGLGLPPPWERGSLSWGLKGPAERAEERTPTLLLPSLEPCHHSAAPCCFSRAALTSLGASFLTCNSQCPAEEPAAPQWLWSGSPAVCRACLAVPSASLCLCGSSL